MRTIFWALIMSFVSSSPVLAQSLNSSARVAFGYERTGDDWDGDCCTSPDPVDSNFCFDSWEEFDQACRPRTPTTPPAPTPREPDEDKI